ncbi:MAG: 23S rRNA (adenine(2503)-C(2))-methyltransferase RlmN [Clostridia bacterium]|nr:23S rRNA (adenine(2503)-C(2))-methyltransferase RlmN [Clostridia bacterium]
MYWMDMTETEIADTVGSFGVPKFRIGQVQNWLYKGVRPQEMTNLPKDLRDKLATIPFGGARIFDKRVSPKDGTIKYLFELEDGNLVEGVLMRYSYGNTVCLSTQVGCNMGCKFCASTLEGCVRSLRHGEMLSFIAEIERDEPPAEGKPRTVTNIVLMGSGEPLDNYDNVVMFLKRVTSEKGPNISARNISLSTCGIVPKIYRLIDDAPHITLSVSLHAHSNEVRSELMPINKAYPIEQVLEAAKAYSERTGRRVVFEYALIGGKNDSEADAKALAARLKGMLCHVNLIPLNPVKERGLDGVTRTYAHRFREWLESMHISATVRREMGADIEGACGQLRRRVLNEIHG